MADHDHIPVRDTSNRAAHEAALLEQKAALQRRAVSKLERVDLEDKYLRIYEENIILKKHARKQEDKIKRMATKLLRLVNDKKKLDLDGGGGGKKVRDIEAEDRMEEMNERMREYEKQNAQLKERLMLAKQQANAASKRPTAYEHVQSRINTGIAKQTVQIDPRITKNIRVMGPPMETGRRGPHSPTGPRYGHSVLEETRHEKRNLQLYVNELQERLNVYELEIESLKEQNRMRESEFEEDILKIKQQITAEQKVNLQENIDMIRLQREVKEKSTRLTALQDKYSSLEENTRVIKMNHDQVLMKMEELNMKLKDEENKSLTLQNELKYNSANQRKVVELQEQVSDLQKESNILKEANEKLVSSAFDLEREREWRQRENALKVQIAQLEATLKADLGEKGGIIDKYAMERDENEKLARDFQELQLKYFQTKEQYDDLEEKMKFFTKESAVDFTEMEEALVLVKQKKQKAMPQPDFLQQVDNEMTKDYHRQLLELQAEYAETVHELEKTRNMLMVQHKINKDYQTEVDMSAGKMADVKKEYEMKLDEFARLLDIRQARIKKLEAQLRDVAYGTRQYKIMPPTEDEDSTIEFDETIHLERGQNLFEIHINKVSLSNDALRALGDEEPSIFCTWEFFEFEIQSTPVNRGPRSEYNFTSQYVVKVDDFFLHYLQKDSCTLELHQSFGQDFQTLAVCQLVFRDIFDKPHGRIHGTATLTGVGEGINGVGFGTVDYWVRLRVPMDQALRLYKERTKALGYITTNQHATQQALQALDEQAAQRPMDNVNELHIKLMKCTGIKSRRKNVQPSPYCVYKFFDFDDHDSMILPNTNNPEFNDHKTYPVPMTSDLDQYLRTVHLNVYVFDDTDPDDTAYLGLAQIPLIPLAHDKGVSGVFELKRADGKTNGCINLELRWQYTYIPPKMPVRSPRAPDYAPDEPPEKLVSSPLPKTRMAAKFAKQGPTATSTPMQKDRLMAVESQIMESELSSVAATQPKPAARRKVQMNIPAVAVTMEDEEQETMIQDAVSQAVSGFMPGMSESISSVQEQTGEVDSSGRGEEEVPTNEVPATEVLATAVPATEVPQTYPSEDELMIPLGSQDHRGGHVTTEDDTEGEELQPKPSPSPRNRHMMIESGSEEDSKAGEVTPKQSPKPMDDTMFEDEESIDEEITEELESQGNTLTETQPGVHSSPPSEKVSESESEPPKIESDSEGLVMIKSLPSKRKIRAAKPGNTVTVIISNLTLEEDCAIMFRDNIKQLFVEYKFLGLDPQETETPFSLPKPKPYQQITYNFTKTIQVDMEKNYERRQYLASMLLPDDPDGGKIRFTLVSEPPEDDQDADCEDVGVVYVSVKDILLKKKDVKDTDMDILDVNDETKVIGQMNLTVECLSALEAVEREMQVEGTY
ncbi:protein fantom-like isoform X2 [Haliotis rufescens]|uniref:protein fantom-like isoform X2 n=1 Tax=Haliotis rufescens TaxID=6454 RepID=UPI00201EB319|nr:protein fantom-like isoform X2 [Haliotis rufescens]